MPNLRNRCVQFHIGHNGYEKFQNTIGHIGHIGHNVINTRSGQKCVKYDIRHIFHNVKALRGIPEIFLKYVKHVIYLYIYMCMRVCVSFYVEVCGSVSYDI